ncbi:MAG: pantoate--beta-alanine ligase [Marinoscillum sp.]
MQVIKHPNDIFGLTHSYRKQGKSIGLVPTMGALHAGHFHLVKMAREVCDVLVVSIFVNPLQFNNKEDLINYPRTLDEDLKALSTLEADLVFVPSEEEMYPSQPEVSIDFGRMSAVMEGEFRPGHFSGVGLVVAKLFNLTSPTHAYFGIKDLQQYLLVKRMVSDLNIPVVVIGVPIVREESGLAMSSRNGRLSPDGLDLAAKIYAGLALARSSWENGQSAEETKNVVIDFYNMQEGLQVEYVHLVDPDNLVEVTLNDSQAAVLCVACYVEGVRLIDNLYLRQD